MRLVFASNNAHKLQEVRQIMPAGIEVLSLREIGFEQEIEETGSTLEENSAIKARMVWAFIRSDSQCRLVGGSIDGVFADDTGLEIDGLNGKPGVYTARWYHLNEFGSESAAELDDDMQIFAANRAKALRVLKGERNRGAQFRTVITLITRDGEQQVEGIVRGQITEEESGERGFGYDSIFMPDGYLCTFAQMTESEKNSISHRGRAMAKLVEKINQR